MTTNDSTTSPEPDSSCIHVGYAYPTSTMADSLGWKDGGFYWCTAPGVYDIENDDPSKGFATPGAALADAEHSRPDLPIPELYRKWVADIESANKCDRAV